jgi:hypothetical protein
MQVSTFSQYAANGGYIRQATKVTFSDGYEVRFCEKLSKKQAIKNAILTRQRDAERNAAK